MGYASSNHKLRSTRWSELVAAVSPFVTSYDMTVRREISSCVKLDIVDH